MPEATPIIAVLLPGIDGTGRNFGQLIAQLPAWISPQVIAYPTQEVLSYTQLTQWVLPSLPADKPYVVIAESFAGPLALRLAERAGENLQALVLCATFVRNPRPNLARLAPLLLHEWVLALPPQKWMARLLVTGFDVTDDMLEQALTIHKHMSPRVILQRLREVMRVDVREQLRACRVPVLHLFAKRDHLILQGATREIQAVRPDIQSLGIDGPHFLLQTRAAQCMAAIVRFLREHGIPVTAGGTPRER
jgi:pimeloyl-[acyl-carrier protein] methyl ester esterase